MTDTVDRHSSHNPHPPATSPSDNPVGLKVAVVGSREFPSLPFVRDWIDRLAAKHPAATIVSGGARGVDTAAESQARLRGLPVISYVVRRRDDGFIVVKRHLGQAELVEQGHRSARDALLSRNTLIVSESDYLVAFHDGMSRGTADAVAKAEKAGRLGRLFTNEELVMREIERGVSEGWLVEEVDGEAVELEDAA